MRGTGSRTRRWWNRGTTTNSASVLGAGVKEGEAFEDNTQFTPFLACRFVIPSIQLQTPFHEDGLSLAQVLGDDLPLLPPGIDIDKGHFLPTFTRIRLIRPIYCETQPRNGSPLGRVLELGVSREIARDDDFVEAAHRSQVKW